jgi:hypothetical protein
LSVARLESEGRVWLQTRVTRFNQVFTVPLKFTVDCVPHSLCDNPPSVLLLRPHRTLAFGNAGCQDAGRRRRGGSPARGLWFERLARSDPWWPHGAMQVRQPSASRRDRVSATASVLRAEPLPRARIGSRTAGKEARFRAAQDARGVKPLDRTAGSDSLPSG